MREEMSGGLNCLPLGVLPKDAWREGAGVRRHSENNKFVAHRGRSLTRQLLDLHSTARSFAVRPKTVRHKATCVDPEPMTARYFADCRQ
jgi:hypothetical protein